MAEKRIQAAGCKALKMSPPLSTENSIAPSAPARVLLMVAAGQGRDKDPETPLQFNRQCAETKCVPNRRQFGAIRTEPGNFQSNDYRSLALSVSNGPACGDFLASEVPKVAELPCTSTLSLQIGD